MPLKIHAICLALNEELFIEQAIKAIYPFCSGISVISQYDRDWYKKLIQPDKTAQIVLNYPDPEGKIHFVVRRNIDEAATRNQEMLALKNSCARGIVPHGGGSKEEVLQYHAAPDYFLIVDADEIYDANTFENITSYLELKRPKGMRVMGYNYLRTWNRRVPSVIIPFWHFGFIKPGILFEMNRVVSLNELRLARLLTRFKLPNIASRLYGFIDCPTEVGVFHHACWIGDDARLQKKNLVSSHIWKSTSSFIEWADSLETTFIPTDQLPHNIQEANWPNHFFEKPHRAILTDEEQQHD